MQNVIDILQERGFIEAMTSNNLKEITSTPLKVYCGFDPTAESLHLGNMVAIMGLAWFQRCGHTPIAIVGGATGMIGDPSGRSKERNILDDDSIQKNLYGIRKNIEAVLKHSSKDVELIILNNYDWFKGFSLVDFLRDVGKYFRVGTMLAKDSVKIRLESEEGLSFTEFSYQLLQGYDFLHLYDHHGVTLEMGGSDQWGNITAGTDLVRKVRGKAVHGLTFPLLTRSDGKKFGKSEQGAIWLSSEMLSPYEFYQYLFRVADADVIKLMKILTFMEMDEIRIYEKMMTQSDYVANTAQRKLAEEVTRIVHGEEGLRIALKVTEGAAPGAATALDAEVLNNLADDMPNYTVSMENILNRRLVDVVSEITPERSKGDLRKLIKNGGVYLNNLRIEEENYILTPKALIDGNLMLIAFGKKIKYLFEFLNLPRRLTDLGERSV
ncbi:tyrosine--tRNA ligase [Parachlamydia acanthamoebae]|uniref:Tyrosine--tRNA ligase n=1 Tax=Parachlamydia acanthamoebae TaxID=83552 RepID=A0A0C1ED15_9BACT|nr:tyrosine--tRNA ligase [Parachlamydia acanthamoebae]KIA77993.1 Tyrosine--tRNA ligase [Parachlamydia acanthamoebae]